MRGPLFVGIWRSLVLPLPIAVVASSMFPAPPLGLCVCICRDEAYVSCISSSTSSASSRPISCSSRTWPPLCCWPRLTRPSLSFSRGVVSERLAHEQLRGGAEEGGAEPSQRCHGLRWADVPSATFSSTHLAEDHDRFEEYSNLTLRCFGLGSPPRSGGECSAGRPGCPASLGRTTISSWPKVCPCFAPCCGE